MFYRDMTVEELASEARTMILSQSSECPEVAEIIEWIESHRSEVQSKMMAPHAVAYRCGVDLGYLDAE